MWEVISTMNILFLDDIPIDIMFIVQIIYDL